MNGFNDFKAAMIEQEFKEWVEDEYPHYSFTMGMLILIGVLGACLSLVSALFWANWWRLGIAFFGFLVIVYFFHWVIMRERLERFLNK